MHYLMVTSKQVIPGEVDTVSLANSPVLGETPCSETLRNVYRPYQCFLVFYLIKLDCNVSGTKSLK